MTCLIFFNFLLSGAREAIEQTTFDGWTSFIWTAELHISSANSCACSAVKRQVKYTAYFLSLDLG